MTHFSVRIPALAGVLVALMGCATSDETAGAGGGGGGGGGDVAFDLNSCNFTLSCARSCTHLGGNDCGDLDAYPCAGELWESGESGALIHESRPGPGGYQADTLTILRGDGTAWRQTRERSCDDISCDIESLPWRPEEAELCDVLEAEANCEYEDGSCASPPQLENCQPASESLSCGEVEAVF